MNLPKDMKKPTWFDDLKSHLDDAKALANEWAGKGINVNAIAPGYMETDNTQELRNNPERNRQILDRIPAGRWGSADDLNGTAVYLASEASRYVHGTIITVDGGWMGR